MQDLQAFVGILEKHFDRGTSVIVTRAPGRLDVMGGIADYSGSLVLQRPIAEATFAAVQLTDQPVINVVSGQRRYAANLERTAYDQARKRFAGSKDHWASYVVGIFLLLMHERSVSFARGATILISSNVPEGKGVASSAALEVAVMQAVSAAFGIRLDPHEMALLCQKAENLVAGAPCGVMDQMTAVYGEADSLLALLCQPAQLQPPVNIPDDIGLWGLDSGERHAVSGADYGSVRTGAFMGLRMISGKDPGCGGYLANISATEFEREFLHRLPDQISGAEFLARHSGITDTVTTVDPSRIYKIRQPTAHPVYEHHRVNAFRQLLLETSSEDQRTRLGELMYQSHESYSACGLGSPRTDLIVNLVRAAGPPRGLYGARITGGGSGGTVAILGRSNAKDSIAEIVETFADMTGYRPYVFSGASSGAAAFGWLNVTI
jgi:galactokinase